MAGKEVAGMKVVSAEHVFISRSTHQTQAQVIAGYSHAPELETGGRRP